MRQRKKILQVVKLRTSNHWILGETCRWSGIFPPNEKCCTLCNNDNQIAAEMHLLLECNALSCIRQYTLNLHVLDFVKDQTHKNLVIVYLKTFFLNCLFIHDFFLISLSSLNFCTLFLFFLSLICTRLYMYLWHYISSSINICIILCSSCIRAVTLTVWAKINWKNWINETFGCFFIEELHIKHHI